MPDDIISFGGPERRSRREADESVESLFHAHYPQVVYTAFSLVGDWDLAEQLAQEAYLRLWRRWRWISDPQAAPMYLQRTVVNLSRETIRRKVIERRALRTRGAERAAAAGPDPAALVELRRAIAALPVRKRECVVLRFLLGLSEAETAALLGISVGTVKSQTHKGLRLLREHIDGPGSGVGTSGARVEGSAWPVGQSRTAVVGGQEQGFVTGRQGSGAMARQEGGSVTDPREGGAVAGQQERADIAGAGPVRRRGRTAT
ncbi:MAG TPA: SigE family RNA polymerase sigma factor [Streptosporangiaceae bacterium]|nr:SigE family RNA polymerase sigma factor [Streptosporangiaceae bacterium]